MEIHVHFKEAFQIVTGTSLQDFYQQKRYEDLTYQQLLELYVYTDIIERGPYHFPRLKVVNGIPVVKATDLKTDPWRALCADVLYHFLQEHTNVAPKETEQGQTEKKTVVTADTSA